MTNESISPTEIAEALQWVYGFSPRKAHALATAGPEQIRAPEEVAGMAALAGRIVQALQRGEPLLIFADFDTDGITGSAVLFRALSRYSDGLHRYNPAYREGYGLFPSQVERFARQGIDLIVTVDSGITSHEAVERAAQLGVEVLITDHHLPRQDLGPPDTTYINPPDHLLSGSQLAYLVGQAVRARIEGERAHDPQGLALAAVGAQVDWVPVDVPETRAWVTLGHRTIRSPGCPRGLRILQELLEIDYVPSDLLSLGGVFNLAKRSHRIDPNALVEALLPETPEERCREILGAVLEERARCGRAAGAITSRAMEDIRQEIGRPGLLIYEAYVGDEALAEVEGPLSSRITAVTGRPTLVLRRVGQEISFSGRARGDFSFQSLLEDAAIRSLVIDMGGHRQAIGGSLHAGDRQAFLSAVRRWEREHPPIEPAPTRRKPPRPLERLDPTWAYLIGRAIGPFGHRLRRPRFRTVLDAKGGWGFWDEGVVELDRHLEAGEWEVTFRFDEGKCDGERIGLQVQEVRRVRA